MADKNKAGWHLDLNVPIALIGAIVLQSGTALWWASAINTRLDVVEKSQIAASGQGERLVRLETKVDGLSTSLSEIKGLLIPQRIIAPEVLSPRK